MANTNQIIVEGACENNLKNVSLKIPKGKMVIITGVSGSGKSSLAFDTIYAEGYRRYIENLSSSARFFLNPVKKPRVKKIENLPPAIAIGQRINVNNPRSTVGTITGIYDFLRIAYAKFGKSHCPYCGQELSGGNIAEVVKNLKNLPKGSQIVITALWQGKQETFEEKISAIGGLGYARVRVDGKMFSLLELKSSKYDVAEDGKIEVVIDRMMIDGTKFDRERVIDSLQTAVKVSKGKAHIIINNESEIFYSQNLACPKGCFTMGEISPKNFSFNSPEGACPHCDGLGEVAEVDIDKVIPNKKLSLAEGAIIPWLKAGGRQDKNNYYQQVLQVLAKKYNFSLKIPVVKIPDEKMEKIFFGSDEELEIKSRQGIRKIKFEGLVKQLEKKFQEAETSFAKNELRKYMTIKKCSECQGKRLRKEFLSVEFIGKTIDQLVNMEIFDLIKYFQQFSSNNSNGKKSNKKENNCGASDSAGDVSSAKAILFEVIKRLQPLEEIGLGYLSLDRSCQTLSGGEFQRIRIATQLYSGLSSVLYVLDEPSIGLHSRDNKKLIKSLQKLKEEGNSVIVVEHDGEIIKAADYIVDMGPGAGERGGEIIFQGKYTDLKKARTETGKYISKKIKFESSKKVSKSKDKITLEGVRHNNLKNLNLEIPLGKMVAIAGVSGSGKSSLINDVLVKELRRRVMKADEEPGQFKKITGAEKIAKVVDVDQSPLGRSSRSNPATYTGVFSLIRDLFAATEMAKEKGFNASHFSFNMRGGRCEYCQGEGMMKIEMHLLDDVYSICPYCQGSRYNKKVKEIKYHGVDITEVLDMNIEYAYHFFSSHPAISNKLKTLCEVGLGYLKLGQSATELSGGEAQRIKLAAELARKSNGSAFYVLDEPTIGLHFSDVDKLMKVLRGLVDKKNSVLIVEHNLDVIEACDWVVELGPEGGKQGGEIIFQGTPAQLKKVKTWTGKMMRD